MRIRLYNAALLASLLLLPAGFARAQSSPGWFVPKAPSEPKTSHASHAHAVRAAEPPPVAEAPVPQQDAAQQQQQEPPMPPLPQPPVPSLPALAKGAPPPTAVIGVLGVPDVMRQSNAAQIIQRVIGARKQKWQADVDRAEAAWREMEQKLQADAPHLSPAEGRAREAEIRERVTRDRADLQARNRIISEAGQVALNQIEATLVAVVKQVAESRGMNVVLHRSQVVLNMPEFDITVEVTEQLNKLLPTVKIPDEDVDPAKLPLDWANPPGTPSPVKAAVQH